MPKPRRVFVCSSCGSVHSKWTGKCPDCGTWDSLEETLHDPMQDREVHASAQAALELAAASIRGETTATDGPAHTRDDVATASPVAMPIDRLNADHAHIARMPSGIRELDRVLGGGLVHGSAVLLGGEPGIGKSTLLLQAAAAWATPPSSDSGATPETHRAQRVLYVSSEESAQQVAMRARRLAPAAADASTPDLFLLADTNLARIIEQCRKTQPSILVIDSIQMLFKPDLPAAPGSITQLRRCAAELVHLAKLAGIAVVLVGHVTKEGALAGPRLLEHMVDAVLSFEGDRTSSLRVVRAVKNRFGATLELGLFQMTGAGLREVPEGAGVRPHADRPPRPGCAVCPVITGSRCILVEIQALTATGFLGAAKRKSSGLDSSRLAMLIAVLEQHAGMRLADRDVFVSAVGGVRVVEPASDLALLLAIAGAHYRKALPADVAVVGEVGLTGEIRPVAHLDQRISEAARLGFATILTPRPVTGAGRSRAAKPAAAPRGVVFVETIQHAIDHLA
jgi:DNA repair protein RadA/Sms